ncbi:GAF and ANTAR domain-containing protein [Mycobacterium sp. ITM-2016-00317]|uniref:GAF and ANTAR domain-containing protein n=1 Tax=Mycobacterium sp. ITM-2016-00317 TaxID=2099694 RepID=UPI000D4D860B|nr:GAF and ANTAR domain-containing protein [Mycobacterium sp. ITM-2016-00317]WNG89742.1 GAF and ANTAR domain-containing protein [Mycobacterium sp. ITM-2016-00317]
MTTSTSHALAVRMAMLARSVAVPRTVEEIFQEVTSAAAELIPGVDTAGILLIGKGGKFESHAITTELPHQLDELQQSLQEGPCLEAATGHDVVRTDDFRHETRWPAYTAAVQKLGVLSSLSLRLYTHDRTAGALNLFGFAPTEWDAEKQMVGSVLAAHAAAAITSHHQGEQLRSAVGSRDRIGQAKGIIMERFGVDEVQAFSMLRRLSQESNTRLTDIAAQVIETRRGAPPGD